MISPEEYSEIRDQIEEVERKRVSRKVKKDTFFKKAFNCPKCGRFVSPVYNEKYCGYCATPLNWDID